MALRVHRRGGELPGLARPRSVPTGSQRITLHIDDVEVLYKIQAVPYGVGTVTKGRTSCTYRISNLRDITTVLLPFLAANRLLTIKQYDYQDFRSMVLQLQSRGTSVLTPALLAQALLVIRGMNSGRTNYPVPSLPILIDPYWLLGFIEGDPGYLRPEEPDSLLPARAALPEY